MGQEMSSKKIDPTLMMAGEDAFWREFDASESQEDRYYVIDQSTGEVIAERARLTKDKKKIKV